MNKQHQISLMDLSRQYRLIKKQVLPAINEVLDSARYINGSQVKQFEEEFAKYCNASYCVGTSNGTDSLILSLRALGIGNGDEVVTVPNTFTATTEAVHLVGAKIVFCEIDPKTHNLDPDFLKRVITKKTKAVIPVHLHGNPCNMDAILKITKPKKIFVIEDASQAHGAKYKGKIIGSLKSDITCFSFHPVKNLGAYGDAGGIVTNSARIAKAVRMLINHGRHGHHDHMIIGTTGRLDTLQAAIIKTKLPYLDNWNKKKGYLANYYRLHLPKHIKVSQIVPGGESANHVFAIFVKERDRLTKFLNEQGIETGMHYPQTLHLQPAYRYLGYKKGDFPIAEQFALQTMSLPLYPHMKKSEIDYVIQKIQEFYS